MKINNKQKRIISFALATWGIILIASGTKMSLTKKPIVKDKTNLRVIQKRLTSVKSNEIKPKDIEKELEQPLSANVRDYLQNPEDIEDKIINTLKLDTSMININQAGSYTYTITYKKKKFTAIYKVKEKELPNVTMTLKNISLEIGSSLSTDIQTYVVENLSQEVKDNSTLNLTNVNTTQGGNYQYTITYNNKLYMGTITIYQPQVPTTEDNTKTPKATTPDNKTSTEQDSTITTDKDK